MSAVAAAPARSDVSSHEAYAERLYERHQRVIFGFCLKQLRRREDADDAVQTTFIYALLSLRRGIVPQMELPWLLTIARNVCSTRRRSGMRRSAHETPHDFDTIQDKLAVPDRSDGPTSDDLATALRAIPENQRKALLLREWQGLSYGEIGTELGLSQGATEALLFRARQNVARRLDERTGVKTLSGMPLFSFLRNLFQTAAAKTAAVGAGAALAIVSIPAAQPARQHPAPQPPVARADLPTASDTATPPTTPHARSTGTAATRHDAATNAHRTIGGARRGAAPAPQTADAGAVVETPATPPTTAATQAPAAVSPKPPATTAPTAPATTAATAVTNTVGDVTQAVSDVGTTVDSIDLPVVPPIQVTTPAITLPAVTVPSVQVHLP
jgi:RNA polymerase sigma factor (sigma-70 family)